MLEAAQGLVTVARGGDLEAIAPELIGEDDEQVPVVVDDQDPWCRGGWALRTRH